ncbi:hypothetical protein [Selenomonas sp. oral taxon 126]|nr:hypothetical protein [Selenomonas sp. oral taxon 126]
MDVLGMIRFMSSALSVGAGRAVFVYGIQTSHIKNTSQALKTIGL